MNSEIPKHCFFLNNAKIIKYLYINNSKLRNKKIYLFNER